MNDEGPPINQGDDIAGIIESVGADVKEFKVGDRVAAFHEMRSPFGSYAEYGAAWEHTTFHIPKHTSYAEAATIPLAAMTSALGIFQTLALPAPWVPRTEEQKSATPVLVYGGGTAVGAFAIKFLKIAQIGPVIVVAGKAQEYVGSLIDRSKGDTVIDYRQGPDAVVKGITDALAGKKLLYAFDGVSEHGSYETIWKVLDQERGKITTVLPSSGAEKAGIPKKNILMTMVGSAHSYETEPGGEFFRFFGYTFYRFIARGLEQGWFSGHPFTHVPGGLAGIQQALEDLKNGKASATKYVLQIDETEGVAKWKE